MPKEPLSNAESALRSIHALRERLINGTGGVPTAILEAELAEAVASELAGNFDSLPCVHARSLRVHVPPTRWWKSSTERSIRQVCLLGRVTVTKKFWTTGTFDYSAELVAVYLSEAGELRVETCKECIKREQHPDGLLLPEIIKCNAPEWELWKYRGAHSVQWRNSYGFATCFSADVVLEVLRSVASTALISTERSLQRIASYRPDALLSPGE